MSYTYDYPRPAVTTDCTIFYTKDEKTEVLLIERKNDPFAGRWALPGGFIDMDETLLQAAKRELAEETGIKDVSLEQFRAYDEVNRDPRGRNISIVFSAFIKGSRPIARAASDAKKVGWFDINTLPKLAFDHQKILNDARIFYFLP